MKADLEPLYERIEALLADPAHASNPLHEALAELYRVSRKQNTRLERITRISDRYQSLVRNQTASLAERYERQLHQLEKMTRISDRYQRVLVESNVALEEASTHDMLTGLPNRRRLMEALREESDRAKRNQLSFAVALLDVDYFKQVNDRYGHDVGDKVLVALGETIGGQLREYDLCGRWGGEEFLLIFPHAVLDEALAIVQRVQAAIHALSISAAGSSIGISASIGVTEFLPGEEYMDTVNRADIALLEAKRGGRDQVVSHAPLHASPD